MTRSRCKISIIRLKEGFQKYDTSKPTQKSLRAQVMHIKMSKIPM